MNDAQIGKVLRREPDAWARAVQDHLAIKTVTGPISGCQCGELQLGESYTEHLRAALPRDIAVGAPVGNAESVAAAETPRWRAGNRVPEHLYRDEVPVATMPAHVVAEIVEVMNEREEDLRLAALSPCDSEKQHPYETYWMRCGLLAPHEERHENSDTGISWAVEPFERDAWARGEQ